MTDTPSHRQRRKESRPGEILTAALAIFHSKGFAASKIEDVALAAGVTKGTVYLYFASKEELFKAAIRETVLPNFDRIEQATQTETSARNRLHSALRTWATGMNSCRGSLSKLMISEAGNFPELAVFYREEVIGRFRRILVDILEYGIARGEFRPCDPTMIERILVSPIILGNIWRHTFTGQDDIQSDSVEQAELILDVVLNGIALPLETSE